MSDYPSRHSLKNRRYRPYTSVKRRVHDSFFPVWMAYVFVYGGLFLAVMLVNAGCAAMVPESKALNAARDAGYTNIEIVDEAWFMLAFRGCDEKDTKRFTAQGINPNGELRQFYVCAGIFKGGTVRSK